MRCVLVTQSKELNFQKVEIIRTDGQRIGTSTVKLQNHETVQVILMFLMKIFFHAFQNNFWMISKIAEKGQ